ncbi:ATP-binding cassette domain-containing protein [Shewanella oneidensis MR-1]|uniref:Type I secretion system ATPase subunit HlyB family n=1 Tax=Shewanella oneidensis (strain ATCC 700550 / JCM 31522 / CIP 106686 / LMG 19005 / NCIMB 14063 / MR-1) TaxID=211586 RepID=Q8E9W6_SHEON|nr:ABC transporter transmembrane domain-containing protein [Shewanella oneidensis]AAN57119.1 type I secretion system ATPase subunit HlyB family [Shewanella oneidensis MR-1]MDX5998555.1 ABC transporter transmembrane domain-containing protein [Shewanella oneidensis]MEE2028401.1 Alpha-hemolysin translocation ATP-binding protein HlyB [Shewanella oneidensis]QKG98392.1 ATP-binding cassette domain-containing protein [Shewanella oneidensis MR-1]
MIESLRLLAQHKSFTELLLSSTLINVLSLALPFTMLQIYDRILPNEAYGTASVLAIGVGIAILLELVLRYTRSWLLALNASNYELQTTAQFVDRLMKADYHHVEQLGSGKILHGITSIATMREIYSGQAAVALMDFPFVIIFLALVAYIGGPLVFIPILVWGIAGIGVWQIGKKLSVATRELAISDDERTRLLILVLSGLTTAKSLALESRITYAYKKINYQRLAQQNEVDWLSSQLQEWIQGASQATTLALVLIGCFEVLNGDLTTGGLAACSILAGRAVAPLSAIGSLKAKFVTAQSAMQDVNEIIASPPESLNGTQVYQQKLPSGPIQFEQVSAQQTGAKLKQINLTIPAGSLVTVTSNPLTHASLLLSTVGGYHQVTEGAIKIDSIPLTEHDPLEYRQSISYVSPWATLLAGSILDNLTLFRHEREAYAMVLADKLGLSATIAQLPAGYQTLVGNNDSQMLNKGAIKLIAIVRALAQSPSILLLDEPMVSLDADSQQRLLALLLELKNHITLIVASYFTEIAAISDYRIHISSQGDATMSSNGEL